MKTLRKSNRSKTAQPSRGASVAKTGWLADNIAKFDRMFASQLDHQCFGRFIFAELAFTISARVARLYSVAESHKLRTVIAINDESNSPGEQLARRCVTAGDVTESNGAVAWPIIDKSNLRGVMSFSAPKPFNKLHRKLLDHAAKNFGSVLDSLESEAHARRLLRQSETLTRELQNQQVWLKHTNDELEEKARLVAVQKIEMEARNRDVEQARLALQDKAHQLALTSKYKSEFLANMSHELRTPLNSMLLLARQLMENREQTLTPKQLEFSKVIHAAGQELLQLVNDILDLAKIEAGKISLEIGEYTPSDLPEFVERNFQLLAESKDLDLTVDLHPNVPIVMQTDERRLEQILKNLLSNALKFTKAGGVTLRVAPVQKGWSVDNRSLNATPSVIAFSVIDTGIGIPVEKQQMIFEAFQQADGTTNREFGGTGLGLTISRELATLLGGEIHLKSEPGKGSVFTLYVPQTSLAPAAHGRALRQPTQGLTVSELLRKEPGLLDKLRGRTALIVDDDIRNIFALTSVLERFHMNVASAEDGQSALDLLQSSRQVDIVLMDIMMPGIDGYAAIQKLRGMTKFKTIPVIAVTAKAMLDDREKCLRAGANQYISKPVDPELLLTLLKECLP